MRLLLVAGLLYCGIDLLLAFALGRCVMPGLKCGACRDEEGSK